MKIRVRRRFSIQPLSTKRERKRERERWISEQQITTRRRFFSHLARAAGNFAFCLAQGISFSIYHLTSRRKKSAINPQPKRVYNARERRSAPFKKIQNKTFTGASARSFYTFPHFAFTKSLIFFARLLKYTKASVTFSGRAHARRYGTHFLICVVAWIFSLVCQHATALAFLMRAGTMRERNKKNVSVCRAFCAGLRFFIITSRIANCCNLQLEILD